MAESTRRIVIIGGVACGPKAAARARRRDPNAEIILIERGRYLSYAGCGLPYLVGGAVSEFDHLQKTMFNLVRDETYFRDFKGIDIRLRTEAERIDRADKTVLVRNLESGETEAISYDRLVLATGASPAKLPIDGMELDGVLSLHSPDDAITIRRKIEAGEVDKAVIIGAGLIGLEAVESLFNHAVDATVLEMADRILPTILDPDMADSLSRELSRDGIEFFTNQRVLRLEGEGKVSKVVTEDREIETDMVIVTAGIRPNVELAISAGLTIGETSAIVVNERMQTSDPNIYAGGDCVECHDIVSGRKVYAPLGSVANRHGRVIGENAAGGDDTFPGIVGTTIMKALNMNVAKTGLTESQARELGIDTVTSITFCLDHVHFMPGNKNFLVKLIAERDSGKLLGAQITGPGDVAKRIDILATALRFGATMEQVANLDLAYSPPFSHALDGVIHAANNTRNRIDGIVGFLTPDKAKERLAKDDVLILLDVREDAELEKNPLEDERVQHIPLSQLRQRMGELSKEAEILCFCQQGLRGYEAALTLQGAGFSKISYLDGGLRMWPYVSQ